ncbi:hypothetical protein V1523DRAFT_418899 [Lipomyces doorenjongii]
MSAQLAVGTQRRTTVEAQNIIELFSRSQGFAVVRHSRRSSPYRIRFLCKCNGQYRSTRGLPGDVGQVVDGKTQKREARSGKLGCKWIVALRFATKQGYWEICATSLVHNHSMDTRNGLTLHQNRLDIQSTSQDSCLLEGVSSARTQAIIDVMLRDRSGNHHAA